MGESQRQEDKEFLENILIMKSVRSLGSEKDQNLQDRKFHRSFLGETQCFNQET